MGTVSQSKLKPHRVDCENDSFHPRYIRFSVGFKASHYNYCNYLAYCNWNISHKLKQASFIDVSNDT